LLDAKAITQTQLPDVLTEWRTPRHPEFSERKNVWRCSRCTEAVKGSLWKLPPAHSPCRESSTAIAASDGRERN